LQRHHGAALLTAFRTGTEEIEEGNAPAEEGLADRGAHTTDDPPSMARYCPVTCREASEARKTMAPFRSSSPPSRWSGVRATTTFSIFSRSPFDIFDGKKPGQRTFTLIPKRPHSAASARVKWIAAALLVLKAMVAISGGFARKPATEAMLMILPEPRGIMQRLPTSWLRKKTASTLRLITLRHASCG